MSFTNLRTWILTVVAALVIVPGTAHAAQEDVGRSDANFGRFGAGKIVVADRASGTISVISTRTDQLIGTYDLPAGDNQPEPMYVYAPPIGRRFFVGDRANNRVVAFDSRTFEVIGTAATDEGVFHMWGSPYSGKLWVNCDISNTMSVINMWTLETVATVPLPADLVAMGGKPHDVILSPGGFFAYVSAIGIDGDEDYVVQFNGLTYEETGRAAVANDPHLSLTPRNPYLYVPAQGGNVVHVLNRFTMAPVTDIAVPGAHGAAMRADGRYFFTTNLPGGGEEALWVIDTRTNTVVGDPIDAPYTVPHNVAVTPNGQKLYVTHSGPNNTVSVFRARSNRPDPEYRDAVTVGDNPFGIAYVR